MMILVINMEKEIIELVNKYVEAVHTQNKEDFYDLWSKNHECRLISIAKEFIGVDSIYNDFLIGLIQGHYSCINLINDGMSINMINDSLAIVVFEYHTECIMRETNEKYGIEGIETQVMMKENDKWKLVHLHYSKK